MYAFIEESQGFFADEKMNQEASGHCSSIVVGTRATDTRWMYSICYGFMAWNKMHKGN